jgi:hypothetical protein
MISSGQTGRHARGHTRYLFTPHSQATQPDDRAGRRRDDRDQSVPRFPLPEARLSSFVAFVTFCSRPIRTAEVKPNTVPSVSAGRDACSCAQRENKSR